MTYLYFLFSKRDSLHKFNTGSFVWFRIADIGCFKNGLILGTAESWQEEY